MKRHQIDILTSKPGRTWASCSCGRKSKQGTVKNAEAWMAKHHDEVSTTKGAKR